MSSTSVVVCTWGGNGDGLPGEVEDVLTLGRQVSEALGGELSWLVLGPMSEQTQQTAGRYGVAKIDRELIIIFGLLHFVSPVMPIGEVDN